MVIRNILSLLLVLSFVSLLEAQQSFGIVGLTGTARVQRSQKRSWEKLSLGAKLNDNDLVETFFQTRIIMQFGDNNLVILGSNSKALLNITPKEEADRVLTEISITLFSGGLFTKAVKNCRTNVYTANAVGVMDSGTVTTVAEGKTGETGFQVLGGLIHVRNIAQQKGIDLRSGLTTMIKPNKEPTAPLYITHRHISVLKHYFGDEYIIAELDASGIKPTDERKGSQGRLAVFGTKARGYIDEGMHRSLFSLSRIYGSVLEDRARNYCFYTPVLERPVPVKGRGTVSLRSSVGFSSHGVSPGVEPVVSYEIGRFSSGIRYPFVKSAASEYSAGFSSLAGILDKVDHVSFGSVSDKWSIHAGKLSGLTFGGGLIVDNFTNESHNNLYHPLGLHGHVRIIDDMTIRLFTADLSAPYVSGFYTSFTPSVYHLGLGYFADINQYAPMVEKGNRRYASHPSSESLYPDTKSRYAPVHCYAVDFTADIIDHYNCRLQVAAEFAQKLFGGNDGFVTRMPSFLVDLKKTSFGAGAVVEAGRLVSHQFDYFYLGNRYRIKSGLRSNFIDTLITPNSILTAERKTVGVSLFYKMNPVPGTDIEVTYLQDIYGKNTLKQVYSDSTGAGNMPGDFSFRLRGAINDTLFRYIHFAEIIFQQAHGRIYPAEGLPFLSWAFEGGFDVVTVPLFFNVAFETGGRFFYIDTGTERNNRIESSDMFFEFRFGINWGFR